MSAYIPKQYDYWPTLALENCEIGDVGIGIDSEKRGERYVPFHPHGPLFEVTCILEGRGVSYAGTYPIKVQKGDIFLSVPFEKHRLDSDPESPLCQEFLTFGVIGERFLPLSDRLWKLGLPPHNRVFRDTGMVAVIDLILEELQNGSKIYRKEILSSLADQAVLRVLRAFGIIRRSRCRLLLQTRSCASISRIISIRIYIPCVRSPSLAKPCAIITATFRHAIET